jgi:hypothetical protein
MRSSPPAESAEILGLRALAWLAGDPDSLEKFLNASWIEPAALRAAADSPETITAVLDFLLANEALLVAFCEAASVAPQAVAAAQRSLGGEV